MQFSIYPLELVRTRLAVCPAGTYKGMYDCFASIARLEGLRGFYRGLLPSLVAPFPWMLIGWNPGLPRFSESLVVLQG